MPTNNVDKIAARLYYTWPTPWRIAFQSALARSIHSGFRYRVVKEDGRWRVYRLKERPKEFESGLEKN